MDVLLEKKIIKRHNKQMKAYYYFRYAGIQKCIILTKEEFGWLDWYRSIDDKARQMAECWYKKLAQEAHW